MGYLKRLVFPVLLIGALLAPATASAERSPKTARIDHLATLPAPAGIGANFKKYADGRTFMFVTGTAGIYTYDVTDGDNPTPAGTLPLPHYENEDVSIGGNRLLISGDGFLGGGILHVIDISNPNVLRLERTIKLYTLGGPGHTTTCIHDCKYAWSAGYGSVYVLNLDEADQIPGNGVLPGVQSGSAASKVEVGDMWTEAAGKDIDGDGTPGEGTVIREFGWSTHDVQVDDAGYAWVVGGNGTVAFDVRPGSYPVPGKPYPDNLLQPTLVARTGPAALNDGDLGIAPAEQGAPGTNQDTVNDFIHHNSWRPKSTSFRSRPDAEVADSSTRPGEVVLITEEDIWHRPDGAAPGGCETQGSFQTWQVKQFGSPGENTSTVKNLDSWTTEFNDALGDADGAPQDSDLIPTKGFCSSHYFSERKGIVATAWYEQGTRFLDVSNPKDIKQVGFFMAPGSTTWATYWSPTARDIVYVIDNNRGVDVLRFDRNGWERDRDTGNERVTAPIAEWWSERDVASLKRHPTFGWVCRLPNL